MLAGEDLTIYDPAVAKVGPTIPIQQSPVTYSVEKTTGGRLGLTLGFGGYFSIDPEVSTEVTKTGIQRIDYSVQAGHPFYRSKNSGEPNGALWTFQENATQKSGLPRVLRTAVLLERFHHDFGVFEAEIKTTSYVSCVENAKEVFRRAIGKIPVDEPIKFDPALCSEVAHGGAVLFGDKKSIKITTSPMDANNLGSEDLDKLITIVHQNIKEST